MFSEKSTFLEKLNDFFQNRIRIHAAFFKSNSRHFNSGETTKFKTGFRIELKKTFYGFLDGVEARGRNHPTKPVRTKNQHAYFHECRFPARAGMTSFNHSAVG